MQTKYKHLIKKIVKNNIWQSKNSSEHTVSTSEVLALTENHISLKKENSI